MTFILIFGALLLLTLYSNCSQVKFGAGMVGGVSPLLPDDVVNKMPINTPINNEIQDSTDTGNPNDDTGDATLFASQAAVQVCDKLDACGKVDASACETAVWDSNKTPARFGLNPSYFHGHKEVGEGEKQKRIHPHATHHTGCLQDISNLDCQSEEVAAVLSTDDLQNVYQVIPVTQNCLGSYEESVGNRTAGPSGKKKRPPPKDEK